MILALSTVPHAILVWDAEPREVGRHALLVGVLDRLALVILAVVLVDGLLHVRGAQRTARARELSYAAAAHS